MKTPLGKIRLGLPKRTEVGLLALFILALFWFDVLQNKVLDKGIDYEVTWFGNVTSSALFLATLMIILVHIFLFLLFVFSLKSRGTSFLLDAFIGMFALFGVAILLAGFVNIIHSDIIVFLGITMKSITFYHIGILIEVVYALYTAFTE